MANLPLDEIFHISDQISRMDERIKIIIQKQIEQSLKLDKIEQLEPRIVTLENSRNTYNSNFSNAWSFISKAIYTIVIAYILYRLNLQTYNQ